jgi:hypothetical protein
MTREMYLLAETDNSFAESTRDQAAFWACCAGTF